ncbi:hypothetical protein [Paraburkholderia phenazinium]|uniref:hypothetical protein n=1 Tax=Paraburkholderia phenazinium TaxID=60549 RepID=UPI00158D1AB0|nr:hypothetical protein [Paraburkholderia phenazinium]
MLFTDANWADSSSVQRAIARPYQPWRCVGWTDDAVCFWVFPERESNRSGMLPDGLLVVDPEVLLDVVAQMSPDAFSVYVMDTSSDSEPAARMRRLTGLWSQARTNTAALGYWYTTSEGKIRPCSRRQGRAPDDAPLHLALKLDVEDYSNPGMVAV